MLWKHKVGILIGWIVLSALGVVGVWQLPAVYRAESLILVDLQEIPERFVAPLVQVSLQDRLATLKQQILSASQLQQIIESFDLYREERKTQSMDEIIRRMRNEVEVTVERGFQYGPGAFRVAYEGPTPVVVAGVVNAISNLFIAENTKTREEQAKLTTQFLAAQLAEAKKSLEQQERRLSEFKRQRMGELPQQETALLSMINGVRAELQTNQEAITRAQQNIASLENSLSYAQTAEARLVALLKQVADGARPVQPSAPPPPRRSEILEAELRAARLRYQDEHPEIRRLTAELADARAQEARERAAAPKPAPESPRPAAIPPELLAELNRERERVGTLKLELELARKELQARINERAELQRKLVEYQGRLERVPIREQELAAITRDYEMSQQNYQALYQKKIAAQMAAELERRQQSERFTILDHARVPEAPVKPNRLLLSIAASLAALALSAVFPLGLEIKRNKLLGPWELPPDVVILGRVPKVAKATAGAGRMFQGLAAALLTVAGACLTIY
ncbi:MAG TPA: GNVR domain-containing protein [Bryobacteraceae bacterium]|nr:GNVR domain-containing protein [Bryobacteraceae bacterium]HPQ16660.1 GNVR domain-containing protein [Bryobacteraceae bacterium]